MPVSSPLYSGIAVWASIVILYVAAALAARKIRQGPAGIIRYLDPVYLTAGTDGNCEIGAEPGFAGKAGRIERNAAAPPRWSCSLGNYFKSTIG